MNSMKNSIAKALLFLFASSVRAGILDGEESVSLLQASFSVNRSVIHGSFQRSSSTSSSTNVSSGAWQNSSGVSRNASNSSVSLHMLADSYRSQKDSTLFFALFTGAHVLYALLAFLYEVYIAKVYDGAGYCAVERKSGRCAEWDLLKMVFMFGVVFGHMYYYVAPIPILEYEHQGLDGSWGVSLLKDISLTLVELCMPGFALVSGIFGQSMNATSLATCTVKCGVVYVATTFLQYCVDGFYLTLIGERWYLLALPFWRVSVSGLFWVCKRLYVPLLLPLCACYLCSDAVLVVLPNTHHPIFQFLPYFAFGCLLPASSWSSFLTNYRVQLSATLFWSCFIVRTFNPKLHRWTEMTYFTFNPHIPPLLSDAQHFIWKLVCLFSWMGMVFFVIRPFQSYAPKVVDVVCSCGSRTVYCYVLHWIFVASLASYAGVYEFLLKEDSPLLALVWTYGMSFLATFTFSSKLTERIFRHVLCLDVLNLRQTGDCTKR
eukprot:TRINITY_DN3475_c0_g4_i1.p1 TRINITY_DN3475_c0_g4~~TRINITY_DN3475_c0_g4_i1.p1  ORF type:complete len:508 (-),score=41.28 TRINITY_DN3475_c0_g4_i1:339-1805(-)